MGEREGQKVNGWEGRREEGKMGRREGGRHMRVEDKVSLILETVLHLL